MLSALAPLLLLSVLLHPGEEVSLSVDLRNDGTETWTSNTSLAPWPRDAASPLANETWVSTTRLAHPAAGVAPGETGTFTVRGGEVGELSLALARVEDGVTWFADIPWGGGPADGFLTLTVPVEAEESDDGGSDGATDGGADGATDGDNGLDTDAAGGDGGGGAHGTESPPARPSRWPTRARGAVRSPRSAPRSGSPSLRCSPSATVAPPSAGCRGDGAPRRPTDHSASGARP